MNINSLSGSNRLIRKSVARSFPACFAATLAGSMSLMVDSLLAGALVNQLAIAAVAIGNPITGVFRALIQAIANGAAVALAISLGRGKKEDSQRIYSLGIIGSTLMGLVFVLLAFFLADLLVLPFGGSSNMQAAQQASLYLRSCAPMILGSSLNIFFSKVFAIYGYQKETFTVALIGAVSNILFSILAVKLLPAQIAIAGLGIGTCIGSFLQVAIWLILFKVKKLPLKLKLYAFKPSEIMKVLKLGFPSSSNNLIDGLIAGLINNIILRGFGGNTTALSVYTAVKGVFSFAQAAPMGTMLATTPLFGLLYGARDKNGIRRTLRDGFIVGLFFSAAWCILLIALLPLLLKFYGMAGNPDLVRIVRSGVYITLLFIPVLLLLRIMTTLFESTEKFNMGLLYSILPDSVIYPVMLVLLIPSLKYTGIWLSYGANGVIFLALLYLVRSVLSRSFRINPDRFLCLNESVRDNVPKLDISITPGTAIASVLAEQVQKFMLQGGASRRSAYMTALSLEELAVDFVAHTQSDDKRRQIMDIKLFCDDDSFRIIMRNAAHAYNPLDFDPDDTTFAKVGVQMVQRVAKRIDYSYVYKMNIVTIDIAK